VRRMTRWPLAFGLIVLAPLGLSACDNNLWQGPLAVRGSDQSLEIAVCTSGPIDEIVANYRNLSTNLDWVHFWEAKAPLDVSRGDVFVNGAIAGAQIGRYTLPELPAGTEMDVAFYLNDSPVASAVFKVPTTGLPADEWLHPDGAKRPEPCEPVN